MIISKADNQHYGRYFEEAVSSYINKIEPINNTNFAFLQEELDEMNSDAKQVADYLNLRRAEYVGRKTSTEDCDIIGDNQKIEIKYVSTGKGTYLNTSIDYLHTALGFTRYHDYMTKYGLIELLEQYFGDDINKNNTSPATQKFSSYVQKEKPAEYKEIVKLDKSIRTQYVTDLYNYLLENPDKLRIFISDMITKEASDKTVPTRIVIFNHKTKQILDLTNEKIYEMAKSKVLKNCGLSLAFDNFRVAIGWQNGTGLNNPTLRVFIK